MCSKIKPNNTQKNKKEKQTKTPPQKTPRNSTGRKKNPKKNCTCRYLSNPSNDKVFLEMELQVRSGEMGPKCCVEEMALYFRNSSCPLKCPSWIY